MLHEEGLDNVFARHDRLAEATRRAVKAWGLETICADPKYYSPTLTAVLLPEGHDADAFRALALEQLQHLLRRELRPLRRQDISASAISATSTTPMLIGALAITEMALALAGVPHQEGRRAGGDGLSRLGARPARPSRRRSRLAWPALHGHFIWSPRNTRATEIRNRLERRLRRLALRRMPRARQQRDLDRAIAFLLARPRSA